MKFARMGIAMKIGLNDRIVESIHTKTVERERLVQKLLLTQGLLYYTRLNVGCKIYCHKNNVKKFTTR